MVGFQLLCYSYQLKHYLLRKTIGCKKMITWKCLNLYQEHSFEIAVDFCLRCLNILVGFPYSLNPHKRWLFSLVGIIFTPECDHCIKSVATLHLVTPHPSHSPPGQHPGGELLSQNNTPTPNGHAPPPSMVTRSSAPVPGSHTSRGHRVLGWTNQRSGPGCHWPIRKRFPLSPMRIPSEVMPTPRIYNYNNS